MKKTFLSICFSLCSLMFFDANAKLTSVGTIEDAKQQAVTPLPENIEQEKIIPENMAPEEIDEYVTQRISKAIITTLDDDSGQNGTSLTSVQPSDEALAAQKEANKSTFEKIYENALNRISTPDNNIQSSEPSNDFSETQQEKIRQMQEWQKPDFDVVSIKLPPNNETTLVPAKEHIPYLFTNIEILSNALVSFDEKIIVIANGQKLNTGLVKSIPLYVNDRMGNKRKVSANLIDVKVNGSPINYTVAEVENRLVFKPVQDYQLQPGIYEYEFKYVVDRQIAYYDDFDEFYWNLTGSSWNLVVARAGATVSIHPNMKVLGQAVLTGYPDAFSDNYILTKDAENIFGFVSTQPLFIGEGMHIITSISKSPMTKPDLTKKAFWFIDDYGDIMFTALGLIAILLSYLISWKYIQKRHLKQNIILRKTAPMMRYLSKGRFDNISFGAFLLEMLRKNIIDLQKNEDNILLIKKTDNLKSLSKNEKKAIDNLFPNKDAILNVNSNNLLKIRRAYNFVEKDITQRFRNFTLRLNLNYLFFSIGMLIIAEFFVALLHLNVLTNFIILLGATFGITFYILLFTKHLKNQILNITCKTLCIVFTLLSFGFLCLNIDPVAALFILVSIITIIVFTNLFAKRNGLVKNNIDEANDYKKYLIKNVENISLGREFSSQQANILALDVSEYFQNNANIKDYYKLDIINEIISNLPSRK